MRTLYFDCFSGAAGDMIVGALLDLGVHFDKLRAALDSLGVSGYSLAAEKVKKKGILATQFRVDLDPNEKQPHRHLKHVVEIIDRGQLPDVVKASAKETFRRIADAEAQVHGSTPERVHFHEVGAVDSIMDVVGAHFCLHELGVERVSASKLHVGAGTVKCAHGVMPVPAPATALLLQGLPVYGGEVEYELITPTGAALLAQLADSFDAMPGMVIERVGYGSGTRDLPDRANVLRALLGESAEPGRSHESITIIEANIDDMSPEMLPPLVGDLLEAGARDAFVTPIVAKKGRPAHLVTALCDEAHTDAVARALFRGSTTLGLRIRREERICLEREFRNAKTPWGEVRVKIGRYDGVQTVASPEFEDCRRRAQEAGVPALAVYNAAVAAAAKGELSES
jgi:hypothetical protein